MVKFRLDSGFFPRASPRILLEFPPHSPSRSLLFSSRSQNRLWSAFLRLFSWSVRLSLFFFFCQRLFRENLSKPPRRVDSLLSRSRPACHGNNSFSGSIVNYLG